MNELLQDLLIQMAPPQFLQNINLIDKEFLDDFENDFPKIIETIKKEQ